MTRASLGLLEEFFRRGKRLVPASIPVAVEDVLGLLPADEAHCAEPVGQVEGLSVQLPSSAEIAKDRRHPGQVCRG